jgi:chemotaxis protein MotB
MARKKKPEEHAHAESWLVSYCDMISLLVTFFLMMMTFSTKYGEDVREIGVGLLGGSGGVFQDSRTMPYGPRLDRESVEGLARDLRAYLERRGEDETATIRPVKDGFLIGFDLDSCFEQGSAQPPAALVDNLRELAPVLARWTRTVVVEGYVEGDFQPTTAFPDADALGVARADAAAQVLLASSDIRPVNGQIASQGSARPRASETSAIGRASNRRVEIRVVALAPAGETVGKGA